MGAVGSQFHFGGGLFIGVLYLALGPCALVLHGWRLARNAWMRDSRVVSNELLHRARRCLPWNVIITLLPFLPSVCQQLQLSN